MKLPFTTEEFFSVFKSYNESVWPAQILLYVLAILSLVVVFGKSKRSGQILMVVLAFLWLWMGIVYHIIFFLPVNGAASIFGIAFIVQGFIFLYYGVFKRIIVCQYNLKLSGLTGLVLIMYSLVLYPLISYYGGHIYPRTPTFGLPCPTTIFTFGILLFSVKKIPVYILIVPFIWSLIGFYAALNLSVKEDYGLGVAGVLTAIILLIKKSGSGIK